MLLLQRPGLASLLFSLPGRWDDEDVCKVSLRAGYRGKAKWWETPGINWRFGEKLGREASKIETHLMVAPTFLFLIAQHLLELTWPLSSSSVSITMEQDFHSQIILQKSSIVWRRGPWLAM